MVVGVLIPLPPEKAMRGRRGGVIANGRECDVRWYACFSLFLCMPTHRYVVEDENRKLKRV